MKVLLLVCFSFALLAAASGLRKLEVLGMDKLSALADNHDSRWGKLTGPLVVKNVGDIWTDCSKSGDELKIDAVVITPDPPKKGANITINATVTLSEDVSSGKINVELKWGFIKVVNEELDLCGEAKAVGKTCPIAKGDVTFSATAAIPGVAPSGHYTGQVTATDQSGNELVCVSLDFHM